MPLRDALQRPEFAELTAAQVVAYLTESVVVSRITKQQTLAAAALVLTDQEQEQVSATLAAVAAQSAAMADYRALLRGPGLDWSDDRFQARLLLLADQGEWSAETLAKMQAIGVIRLPRWEKLGLEALPTESDVTAARATIATDELRQQVAERFNTVMGEIDAGTLLTWQSAREALGAE